MHRHLSMETLQAQIRDDIARQGFSICNVVTFGAGPDFSYTVGLHTPGSKRPELCISGLSLETRMHWLLDLGFRIQGPPPLATRERMAQAQRVPVEALTFPPGGQEFVPGVRYLDLAENGLPTCFGEVEQHYYDAHFGQAMVFHGKEDFPVQCCRHVLIPHFCLFEGRTSILERCRENEKRSEMPDAAPETRPSSRARLCRCT